jgi:ABC-2 type transport system ATP-binding protein
MVSAWSEDAVGSSPPARPRGDAVSAPPAIETLGLTKRYGGARGIESLSLTVRSGEVFGFLGPNGAGKTTTIRTLLGFLHPTSGTARVLGLDFRRDAVAIRARIGNLPGELAVDPAMTGRELLRLFARLRGLRGLGDADALAARFRAELDRPLEHLSKGNRQKVGLIQAMFHHPELLVLDEPTSGLDPLMQEVFVEVIAEQRARGATVFLSSHNLAEVERVCDRVGIIREGRLVAVDGVDALTGRAYKRVSVTFRDVVDLAPLRRLPGVSGLEVDGATVTFRASGELDPVLKLLARHHVVDMELERPSLEELFLTFYADRPAS